MEEKVKALYNGPYPKYWSDSALIFKLDKAAGEG
jgi:hypothetical protein